MILAQTYFCSEKGCIRCARRIGKLDAGIHSDTSSSKQTQKGIVEETLTNNQKFWMRCLIQEVRGTEEHLGGVKKTSHYGTMEYINKQANQREFLRKLGSLKPQLQHVCLHSPILPIPEIENRIEEEVGSVPLEILLVRLFSSPWEEIN